jgi:CHAT domain-containing protein
LWGPAKTRLLTGSDAAVGKVEAALRSNPSIVHFATHVITGSGEYASGMIALSLEPSGAVGLLGPREIVAHPVTAALVVLNGCHSGKGETLPSAGLMGLTRAWIGAGAGAVLATRWDIPDDEGRTFIATFYRALKAHPERGAAFALQQSQLELMRGGGSGNKQNLLAAYFLLGRA